MLSPDQIGAAGDEAAGAAARAGDVLVSILSAEVAGAVGAGDLSAALLGSGRVPQIVLRALGANPLLGRATASRAVREALYESARSDALAAGVEPDYGGLTASAVELEGELRGVERRANLSMAEDARASYLRIVSDLIPRAAASEISRERAVAEGVRRMAERGVRVVDYASGRRDRPEVVMRRHVQTLLKRASTGYTADLCRRAGVRLVEVDSHPGARPSHRKWQGRVYGLDGPVEVGGVRYPGLAESGAEAGLAEPNCRHSIAPYVPGRSRRWSETPDGDAGRDPEEAYEATQRQRANERAIRDAKREADALRAEGLDDSAARLRLGRAQAAQRRLLADNPWLKRRPERERAFDGKGRQIGVRPLSKVPERRPREGVTGEVRSRMQAQSDRVFAAMTSEERSAMKRYTKDGDYEKINGPLFSGAMPAKEKYRRVVRGMDSAIKKYQLEDGIIAYKGTDAAYFEGMDPGSEGTWGGFYSVALSEEPTKPFMRRLEKKGAASVLLEVRIPEGTSGIYVGDNTDFKIPQDEFVLARGTSYRVVDRAEGKIVVEVIGRAG